MMYNHAGKDGNEKDEASDHTKLSQLEPVHQRQSTSVQCQFAGNAAPKTTPHIGACQNATGIPAGLKSGLERLSGFDLSPVRVHYNSPKPAQIGALAYAQGSNIHLGPGQEKHLPHEGWHVVQQMQGRVMSTAQYKNVAINDNALLELEADVMGAKAARMGVPLPGISEYRVPGGHEITAGQPTADGNTSRQLMPVNGARFDATDIPIQCVLVKLNKARSRGSEDYYSLANTGDPDAIDTETMTLEQKLKVLADLQKKTKNKKYLEAIESLTAEIASIKNSVDEREVVGMSRQLDVLLQKHEAGNLDESDGKAVKRFAFRMLNALDFLGEFDEGEKSAERLRVLVLANLEKIQKIDGSILSESVRLAGRDVNLNISAEEINAYREDIRTGGVWGGGAEAAVVAAAFHQYLNIYILDSNDNYVLVDTIGDTAGAQAGFSIVNQGNHYVAVDNGHATGDAFNEGQIRHNPDGDGNCMFNALYYALSNADAQVLNDPLDGTALDETGFRGVARRIASTDLTDQQIQLSITEVLMSGQRAGIGPNLRRFIDFRTYDSERLYALIGRSKVGESEIISALRTAGVIPHDFSGGLKKVLNAYSTKNSKNPKAAAKILDVILNIVYDKLVSQEDLITDEPSSRLELALRKSALEKYRRLSGYTVTNSPHNDKQLIIEIDSEEFVIDRIGQLVPRCVVRSISDQNISELRDHHAIYPSNQSPVEYDGSPSGSGIGDNKIKATLEMLHVEGEKPSNFLSTTKQESGTKNPTGGSFGSELYEIDLAYINPECISDLSSHRGISYYMLGNYEETDTSPSKAVLIAEAEVANQRQMDYREQERRFNAREHGVKKPTPYGAEDKARENSTLSGKEWQALMDVLRTSEILISCPIPGDALTKK
ncbi:MAG TPA: DUF4157 domain-containing protein [Gammaproteobacteria bacterium]